jgi:hypothetical protein
MFRVPCLHSWPWFVIRLSALAAAAAVLLLLQLSDLLSPGGQAFIVTVTENRPQGEQQGRETRYRPADRAAAGLAAFQWPRLCCHSDREQAAR